jgi:putative DNA primase/helicase
MSKGGSNEALMRVMGSIATVAAARATYLIAKDKDDPTRRRRLFLPVKNNLGDDTNGFAFTIHEKPTGYDQPAYCIAVTWEDKTVQMTADDALAPKDGRGSEDLEEAKRIIHEALVNGPVLQSEVEDRLTAEDIGRQSWRNAKKKLGVKSRRRPGGGKNGPWEWFWPEGGEGM